MFGESFASVGDSRTVKNFHYVIFTNSTQGKRIVKIFS